MWLETEAALAGLSLGKMSVAVAAARPWTKGGSPSVADRSATMLLSPAARIAATRQAMIDLFAQFDHCYMISMATRTDRRQQIAKQLARYDLDFETLGIKIFDACRFDDADGFPSIGVRGCFNSHMTLMRRCADSGKPMLVLEDDICFDFARIAEFADRPAAQNWDVLYLGYLYGPKDGQPKIDRAPDLTTGGHCYAVRPEFARAIADFMETARDRPAGHPDGGKMYRDGAFNFFRGRHPEWLVMASSVPLAVQNSSRSDLTPSWRDRLFGVRHIVAALRRIRETLS